MQYLDSFRLPTDRDEVDFILPDNPKALSHTITMECYSNTDFYPFKLFPGKGLSRLDFAPITIFYGNNGSGKSTLLNIIGEKLKLRRIAPFNNTPFFEEYLKRCRAELTFGHKMPKESALISSDDVFDFLLDLRALNNGVDARREALFDEYERYRDPNAPPFRMQSLADYEELKARNDARRRTKSDYTTRRLPHNIPSRSNGESAFECFTTRIKNGALYLLDEPENSLSATLQKELARFIADSARFYKCQFVISTHSPFLLAMKDAVIYDLDCVPVTVRPWTELANVRAYYDFFKEHAEKF